MTLENEEMEQEIMVEGDEQSTPSSLSSVTDSSGHNSPAAAISIHSQLFSTNHHETKPQTPSKQSQPTSTAPPVAAPVTSANTATYTQLPVARVKKIMRVDETLLKMSADAAFTCAIITEQFLNYFVRHAHQYTQRDKRKIIAYKDMSSVVAEVEQFSFLNDVVPQTVHRNEVGLPAPPPSAPALPHVQSTLSDLKQSGPSIGDEHVQQVKKLQFQQTVMNPAASSAWQQLKIPFQHPQPSLSQPIQPPVDTRGGDGDDEMQD